MPDANTTEDLVFIDLEASGLSASSWPIEVGWASLNGLTASYLIKPHNSWPLSAWSETAQTLHGITLEELAQKGRDCSDVCSLINAALEGKTVYSDAPDWDSFWLMRAFRACEVKPRFFVGDFSTLFDHAPDRKTIQKADDLSPRSHRAAADAKNLRTLYTLIKATN